MWVLYVLLYVILYVSWLGESINKRDSENTYIKATNKTVCLRRRYSDISPIVLEINLFLGDWTMYSLLKQHAQNLRLLMLDIA